MKKCFRLAAKITAIGLALTFAACSNSSDNNAALLTQLVNGGNNGGTPSANTYTVTFNSDGGSPVASQTVTGGQKATKPTDPAKTGDKTSYVFLGWYNGTTLYDFNSTVTSNISLKAKWLEGFVSVAGKTVNGAVSGSEVFITGRTVPIPAVYVCDHEVTQGEYETYCKYGATAPGDTCGKGADYPVYNVSWYDAVVYCNLRSKAEGLTPVYKIGTKTDPTKWDGIAGDASSKWCGPSSESAAWNGVTFDQNANGYRLPTEAEWEYIARNKNTDSYAYSGSDTIGDVAWYYENSDNKTHKIKTTTKANGLGIYDMSGNVYEWCWDWFKSVSSSTPSDGESSGTARVRRGGGWNDNASSCTVAARGGNLPTARDSQYGFRVVRSAQ